MADPLTSPSLPSTADTIPYVPISWMAVAAMSVAALFVFVLLGLGVTSFVGKKPLIMPELLVFSVIGVVLSFAARRIIRNSEGTRTGDGLVNYAWWTCVIMGLGYAAYLFAIDFSIRRDAENEVQRWVGYVMKDEVGKAFVRTLPPERRGNVNADNTAQLEAEFRPELLAFRQSDLVRTATRNKGECTFTVGGLKDWNYRPQGVECMLTGLLKCAEGTFPVNIPLRGSEGVTGAEGGAGRQWSIFTPPNGFMIKDRISLTPYGWLVAALERSGNMFGGRFIDAVGTGPETVPYLYQAMIHQGNNVNKWVDIGNSLPGRLAIGGGPAAAMPYTNAYVAYFPDQFLKLPGGGTPSAEQKSLFKKLWESFGIVRSGGRLKNNPDNTELVRFTDTGVEVTVPCELPMMVPGGAPTAARCRLVVALTDPALVAELKELKSKANPDQGTSIPPESLRVREFPWRVVRLETDLYPITVDQKSEGEGGP